jgi:hypothetical protein
VAAKAQDGGADGAEVDGSTGEAVEKPQNRGRVAQHVGKLGVRLDAEKRGAIRDGGRAGCCRSPSSPVSRLPLTTAGMTLVSRHTCVGARMSEPRVMSAQYMSAEKRVWSVEMPSRGLSVRDPGYLVQRGAWMHLSAQPGCG